MPASTGPDLKKYMDKKLTRAPRPGQSVGHTLRCDLVRFSVVLCGVHIFCGRKIWQAMRLLHNFHLLLPGSPLRSQAQW